MRKVLVALEVALALMLLVGASLVIRTLLKLQDVKLGYDPGRVLSLEIPLAENHYGTITTRNRVMREIVDRVQAIPGVQDVTLNTFVHPFANWGMRVEVPGNSIRQRRPVIFSQINNAYPSVFHIPIKQGVAFSTEDVAFDRHVALVNETLVRTYFPDGQAVGRSIRLPELKGEPIKLADDTFRIVGVLGDVRNVGLEQETYPEVYVPYTTTGLMEAFIHPMLLVTAHVPLSSLTAPITARIHAVDPEQPVMRVETVQKILDDEGFAGPRFSVFLFSVFAGLGLALSAIGIYGVLNYSVSRQMQALGVRLALGAGRSTIVRLIFGEALRLVLAGIFAGTIGALIATRWLSSLTWGVSAMDPLSFLAVAILLLGAGIAACVRPAIRASRVDPIVVLRYE